MDSLDTLMLIDPTFVRAPSAAALTQACLTLLNVRMLEIMHSFDSGFLLSVEPSVAQLSRETVPARSRGRSRKRSSGSNALERG